MSESKPNDIEAMRLYADRRIKEATSGNLEAIREILNVVFGTDDVRKRAEIGIDTRRIVQDSDGP
ncbi:MAG: hypothetical protein K8U03_10570 [Planctomycetia bacterium]|nr:hypothetical protein [Planctomycetia bacterium]